MVVACDGRDDYLGSSVSMRSCDLPIVYHQYLPSDIDEVYQSPTIREESVLTCVFQSTFQPDGRDSE